MSLAIELHGDQARKGTGTPYLSHLIQVAGLVLEHGGSETEAAAALLHDAAEDAGGEAVLARIADEVGKEVAEIVRACSDALVEDRSEKRPWWPRKMDHLKKLPSHTTGALRVVASDKLHNARAIVADLRAERDALWERFKVGPSETVWYYRTAALALKRGSEGSKDEGLERLVSELEETVERMAQRASSRGD